MNRLGVRGSATLFAMIATAIAVVVAAVLLLITLRQTLVAEIDRSLRERADTITFAWSTDNRNIPLSDGLSASSFAAVIDGDGYVATTSDVPSVAAVRAAVTRIGEPFTTSVDVPGIWDADARTLVLSAEEPFAVITSPSADGTLIDDDAPIVFVASSLDPVADTVQKTMAGVALLGPLFVPLVGVMTWFLTGRSLRPVEAIRLEVERISAGDLGRRVPETKADDEVGRLSGTMNHMLRRLERSQQAQQQFVSDASHELRSPLAAMAAMLDVAERHGTADEWSDTANRLQLETDRMRRMVDDLLLLVRSEGADGSLPTPRRALVDLDDVVLATIEVTADVASRSGSDVSIDSSRVSAGLVSGDVDQLGRMALNLITNAVRHATSTVRVSLNESEGFAVLTVDDDGGGIPEADRARVFERFVRLDEARGRDAGGSGLGLAIAAECVAGHGGTIVIEDSTLGGARFVVRLPVHRPPPVLSA